LEEISPDERQELSNLIDTVQAVEPVRGEDVALKSELRRLEGARMTVDACSSVMSTLSGDGGGNVVDTQGSVRSGISNASIQIKGLLSNAQRSAPGVSAEGGTYSSEADEDSSLQPNSEDSSDETDAALAGLRDALLMCREAEVLISEAERRVANYLTLLRADPYHQEECVGRLRQLDRLCRSIGVRNIDEACDAAEVSDLATHRIRILPFVSRLPSSFLLRKLTQALSSTLMIINCAGRKSKTRCCGKL
jgi:DNA repair ATPase RecN